MITASSNVIGFLFSFIFASATLSEGNPVITTLEAANFTTQSSNEGDKNVNVSSLPFSTHLANPCSATQRKKGHRIMENHKSRYATEFYKYITSYANWYKGDTQNVLNEFAISDCTSLGIDILPGTPSLEELLETDVETAINQIYHSLLVHSAYVYLINHQYKDELPRCPEVVPNEKLLAAQSLILANKQKSLVCTIETSMSILGYNQNSTNSILEHEVTLLTQCSHMAIRDCQVLRSIIHLLNIVSIFAQSQSS